MARTNIRPQAHRPGRHLDLGKLAGLALCAIPVAFLALFMVGELAEGEIGGLGHAVQAAPLVLLLLLAWWRPLIGGALIVLGAVGLAAVYLLGGGSLSMDVKLLTAAIIFLPPALGGLLLVRSGRASAEPREGSR